MIRNIHEFAKKVSVLAVYKLVDAILLLIIIALLS